mmetsp:Transcript_6292/g.7224  ORF Transcript_6292/g.7224 Transcript_6292/m.7224 type:complete len:351 (+) Transcript_6292:1928-2980(+)
MLAVLIKSGSTNALKLTTGKGRLEDISSINGSFSSSSTDEGVNLINHKNDVISLLDFLHELLQALFELTTVLGTSNQESHVKADNPLAFDGFRNVSGGDHLGKALCNSGLTNTRLTDQARVVLGTTAQNLCDTLDLLGTTHNRVQLGLLCKLCDISSVLFQSGRLVCSSRLVSGAGSSADRLTSFADHTDNLCTNLGIFRTKIFEHTGGNTLALTQQTKEKMLGTDVVVPKGASLVQGKLQNTLGPWCERDLDSDKAASATDDLLNFNTSLLQVNTHTLQHLCGNTGSFTDESKKNLFSSDEVMAQTTSLFLSKHDNLDCLLGEAFEHHLCDELARSTASLHGGRYSCLQ